MEQQGLMAEMLGWVNSQAEEVRGPNCVGVVVWYWYHAADVVQLLCLLIERD